MRVSAAAAAACAVLAAAPAAAAANKLDFVVGVVPVSWYYPRMHTHQCKTYNFWRWRNCREILLGGVLAYKNIAVRRYPDGERN